MRVGVLTAAESWYFRDLQRAAGPDDQLTPLPFSRLAAHVSGSVYATHAGAKQLQRLEDLDVVLVLSLIHI